MDGLDNRTKHALHKYAVTFAEVRALESVGGILSLISALLLVPILCLNLCQKKGPRCPMRLTTIFVACNLGLHLTVLVGIATHTTDFLEFVATKNVSEFCRVQGVFYQFFAAAMTWLFLLIVSMLYLVVVQNWRFSELQHYESLANLLCLVCACVQTALPFHNETAEPQIAVPVCDMAHSKSYYFNQFAYFVSEMLLCLIITLFFMYQIVRKLWSLRAAISGSSSTVARATRSIVLDYMVQHVLILVFFVFVFVLIFVTRLLEYRFSKRKLKEVPFAVCLMHDICSCGLGIFTFITIGTSKSTAMAKSPLYIRSCCSSIFCNIAGDGYQAWDLIDQSKAPLVGKDYLVDWREPTLSIVFEESGDEESQASSSNGSACYGAVRIPRNPSSAVALAASDPLDQVPQ